MLYFRLGAGDAPKKTILGLLAEAWAGFVLAAVVLTSISYLPGQSQALSAKEEIADFAARWSRLNGGGRGLFLAGLAAAAGIFGYALHSIRRALRQYPL